ncbi:hypothetical protein Leryth_004145 [Lithospermum erythrorhizon]|nr:hypothetical protein Leryth_004145 [Lithospermum erythrorhizon]
MQSQEITPSSSFEQIYRNICNELLSLTRLRTNVRKGTFLHAQIIKLGIQIIPFVSHHLINFYSKLQLPFDAQKAFHETVYKSSTTWSSIISCLSQNDVPFHALQYFQEMHRSGYPSNDFILPCVTKACGIVGEVGVSEMVHCLGVKNGFFSDVYVGSGLVDMYAKCGRIDEARRVFDEMPKRNVVSWSGMIYGYAQMGDDEEALLLFKCAVREELVVNDFSFSSVVRVCGNSTLLELGRQIHGLCLKMSYDSSTFVGSALISMYSKCGLIGGAYRIFDEVFDKNLGMWNAMLIACAQHGHTKKVFELFKTMERSRMKPNFITFLCMLYACSHTGLVEEGKHYFGLMKQYGIEPGDQHYASMVDLLGRAGKLQEALEVINEMPMPPTESVWGALLTGCRIHKDTDMASYVADRVFQLGAVSSGLDVILANAYSAAGQYEEAARARKMLRDRGVKKETGLSWIEEGNHVHTFAAGERRHYKSKEIYQKLEELGEEMERVGYVADTSFVLQEVGREEKSQSIQYHSERIAIAFALITFPPERPIRIMKNLRMCGDCHNAIKFMTLCTGRVIIVRDNSRFHMFSEGKCSCGDYW